MDETKFGWDVHHHMIFVVGDRQRWRGQPGNCGASANLAGHWRGHWRSIREALAGSSASGLEAPMHMSNQQLFAAGDVTCSMRSTAPGQAHSAKARAACPPPPPPNPPQDQPINTGFSYSEDDRDRCYDEACVSNDM